MKINKLDVYYVTMPLIYPWRTAYGSDSSIHSILVKATSDNYSAWSESTPLYAPTYSPESAISVFHNVTEILGPYIINKNFESPEELNQHLNIFKGNHFAKAAIEICWWTLQSTMKNIPLHELLGGQNQEVVVGADFGIQDSIDMLITKVDQAVQKGFPRVKLKVAKGWDYDVIHAVRTTFPNLTVHIDCNGGDTLDDLSFFKSIDKFELVFIEQPLKHNDFLDHAELATKIETPICLDESIIDLDITKKAIKYKACEYINIKPGRVGGLANAIAIHDFCQNEGIPVWIGGMLESALGASICIELATLPNCTYPADVFPSSNYYETDLCSPDLKLTPNLTFKSNTGSLPQPDKERLRKQTYLYKEIVG